MYVLKCKSFRYCFWLVAIFVYDVYTFLFNSFFDSLVELSDKLLEDQRVNIFAQLIEQKPVSNSKSTANGFHFIHHAQSGSALEQHLSKSGHEEYYEPVTDLESSNDGEDNKPEPKEDVNLLVDNVQR